MLQAKIIWAIIIFMVILFAVALLPSSTSIFLGLVLHAGLMIYLAFAILMDTGEDMPGDRYMMKEDQ